MKKLMNSCVAIVTAAGLSCLLLGCDQEVARVEKTKVKSDGTVEQKETVVKKAPDGTIIKEESETKTKPPPTP